MNAIYMNEDNSALKGKIKRIVEEYIKFLPEEYAAFKAGMKEKRDRTWNRTGKIEGTEVLDRPIHEIPESLYGIMNLHLNDAEKEEFQSQVMTRWFAKSFPDFSVVEKV